MELPKVNNTALLGGAAALIGLGAVGAATAVIIHKKRKKKKKKSAKYTRKKIHRSKKGRKLKFGSKAYRKKYLKHGRKTPYTAGKRRDRSHKRIRYTKRGQPYVIGAHGKARFISRKSAKLSYHKKGGRY